MEIFIDKLLHTEKAVYRQKQSLAKIGVLDNGIRPANRNGLHRSQRFDSQAKYETDFAQSFTLIVS